jgi:hypothetical protein
MKTHLMFLIIEATIEYGTLDIVKLPVKFTHAYMRIVDIVKSFTKN